MKLKSIPRDPIFSENIFNRTQGSVFPLGGSSTHYFGYGRVALLEGLKLLGIEKGDNVLVPNYICQVIMAPFNALEINVNFYSIKEDLSPDWDDIKDKMNNRTKALLLVNYFGFPNDIEEAKEVCRRNKLYFIEDNAHGFLSAHENKPLGSFGDISIFNFHKTVPLTNGAALVVNNQNLKDKPVNTNYPSAIKKDIGFLVKRSMLNLQALSTKIVAQSYEHMVIDEIEKEQEFHLDDFCYRMSDLSRWLINCYNYDDIKQKRRHTYERWVQWLSSKIFRSRCVYPELSDGVVPYVCPVIVENPIPFMLYLAHQGIGAFPWPYLPEHSNEKFLSKHLVCLPVFPSFNPEEMIKESISL